MYLKLKKEVMCSSDQSGCFLFNSFTGKHLSLIKEDCKKLKVIIQQDGKGDEELIDRLLECGMIEKSETISFEDNFLTHNTKYLEAQHLSGLQFDALSIQISNKCTLDCYFCNSEINRKCGCNRWFSEEILTIDEIKDIIKKSYIIGIKKINFIGGDVFKEASILYPLLDYIKKLGLSIEIFSNLNSLNDSIYSKLLASNVSLIIPVFHYKKEIVNEIVKSDYFDIQQSYIKRFEDDGINYRVKLILSKNYYSDQDEILKFYKNKIYDIDYLLGDDEEIFSKYLLLSINSANYQNIQIRREFNVCMFGVYHLNLNGDILPCCGVHKPLGNVKKMDFIDILRKSLDKKIFIKPDKCKKDCKYNVVCSRCEAINSKFLNCKGDVIEP